MGKTKEVLKYLSYNYGDYSLLEVRLERILYFIDWKSCIEYRQKITDYDWVRCRFGVYAKTFDEQQFSHLTLFDRLKIWIGLDEVNLSDEEKWVVDFVMKTIKYMSFFEITRLLLSTYPVINSDVNCVLKLVDSAGEYEVYKKKLGYE